MDYPKSVQKVIEKFKKLPNVGSKTATKYALAMLHSDISSIEEFTSSILEMKMNLKKCEKCQNYYDTHFCPICSDSKRDKSTLLVVSNFNNLLTFENSNHYNGLYFTLNGLINPSIGKLPNNVLIPELLIYIKQLMPSELILALSPTLEGETTSLYIKNLLAKEGLDQIKITKLAYGLPFGVSLEYIDALTVQTSFDNRVEYKTKLDKQQNNKNNIQENTEDEY